MVRVAGDLVVVLRDGSIVAESEITGIEMVRTHAQEASADMMIGVLLRARIDVTPGDVIRVAPSA